MHFEDMQKTANLPSLRHSSKSTRFKVYANIYSLCHKFPRINNQFVRNVCLMKSRASIFIQVWYTIINKHTECSIKKFWWINAISNAFLKIAMNFLKVLLVFSLHIVKN